MKVEVAIADGKNCGGCPFFQDVLDSFNYEETHYWCAYLKRDLTEPSDMPPNNVEKPKDCPSVKSA